MTKRRPSRLRILPSIRGFFTLPKQIAILQTEIKQLKQKNVNLETKLGVSTSKLMTLQRQLEGRPERGPKSSRIDKLYRQLEDRFRGPESLIMERLTTYVPDFQSLPAELQKLPVIDIGSGRGEFLGLMSRLGFRVTGVDTNKNLVWHAQKLGYNVVEDDALHFLRALESDSLAAVTGFHIVEHIPTEYLLEIFSECYRTVAPGGFALFETPNPQTISVGANTFYLDPSHLRPTPSQLLSFLLESAGFVPEVRFLHPLKATPKNINKYTSEMHETLYGPGDYAVLAQKTKA